MFTKEGWFDWLMTAIGVALLIGISFIPVEAKKVDPQGDSCITVLEVQDAVDDWDPKAIFELLVDGKLKDSLFEYAASKSVDTSKWVAAHISHVKWADGKTGVIFGYVDSDGCMNKIFVKKMFDEEWKREILKTVDL